MMPVVDRCAECGDDILAPWFVKNDLWNRIMHTDKLKVLVICMKCFVRRADTLLNPTGWELVPEGVGL